jgi:hypothetical protein
MGLLEQRAPGGGSKRQSISLKRPPAGRLRALPKKERNEHAR